MPRRTIEQVSENGGKTVVFSEMEGKKPWLTVDLAMQINEKLMVSESSF